MDRMSVCLARLRALLRRGAERFRKWTAGGGWGPHAERRRTSAANWKEPRRWNAKAPELSDASKEPSQPCFRPGLSDFLQRKIVALYSVNSEGGHDG